MAAPTGNKAVQAGSNHPGNNAHGNFNHAPGGDERVGAHHNGAGRFPGTGTTGGATRHGGPENASAVAGSGQPDSDMDGR